MIIVITENMFRSIQTLETSVTAPLVANILLKLYKKFDFTNDDLQKIQSHFNFKETFGIFVQAFHQVEIIANSFKEEDSNKSSPQKSEISESAPASLLEEENSQIFQVNYSFILKIIWKELSKSSTKVEPQNKNSRTQASIKPFLANKDTTTDACKTKIEDIKTLVQVFNNIFVRLFLW